MSDDPADDGLGEAYHRAILRLLPQGALWPTDDPTSTLSRFWAAVAALQADHHRRTEDLLREADPAATLELLAEWERMAGLPDPCAPADATIEERRLALLQRLAARGGQSIAYFQGLAEALGYEVEIEERRPFTFGRSGFGESEEFAPDAIRFHWRCRVLGPRVVWFEFGLAELGVDAFGTIRRAEDLECILQRLKPAQTVLTVAYEGA